MVFWGARLRFQLHAQSPQVLGFVPADFYSLDIIVTPVWGLYAFVLGVIDVLQAWTFAKVAAHAIKFAERNKATVPPGAYARRFLAAVERQRTTQRPRSAGLFDRSRLG